MQTNDRFDDLLRDGLAPGFEPGDELNSKLIAKIKAGETSESKATVTPVKKARISTITKIVAAAAAVVVAGAAGTYAASKFMAEPEVIDHGIFIGNSEYVDDKALATMDITEPQSPGYHTETKHFKTYEEGRKEVGFGATFDEQYELTEIVETSVTTGPDNYKMTDIGVWFKYGDGIVHAYFKKSEGNIASDVADVVLLANTSNERDYTTKDGITFTLVDEKKDDRVRTHIMLKTDEYVCSIMFDGLSDKQIHHVLESMNF